MYLYVIFHNQIKEKEHWLFIYTKKISETHIHLLQLKYILLMKQKYPDFHLYRSIKFKKILKNLLFYLKSDSAKWVSMQSF